MQERIKALQHHLATLKIDGFFQTMTDEYHNEATPFYAKRILWVSGFRGSTGIFVTVKNQTALFVDSRYTLQAKNELTPQGINVESYGFSSVRGWILQHHKKSITIGFDPWILSYQEYLDLTKVFQKTKVQFVPLEKNPIDALWKDQPPRPKNPVTVYEIEYAGVSREDKVKKITDALRNSKADYLFLGALDSIAWLLNLRGTDTPRIPLFLGYLLMDRQGHIVLFTDPEKFAPEVVKELGPTIKIVDEILLDEYLKKLGEQKKCFWISPNTAPYHVGKLIQEFGGILHLDVDPCQFPKAIKNSVELDNARKGHIQDGLALVKFFAFLESQIGKEPHTEVSLATQLNEFRLENPLCLDLSFYPVSAVGSNSALPHYRPYPGECLDVKLGDIYLVDSGGQYKGATTDITRVIALGGNPTPQQKEIYTLVLKGHIAIALTKFPKGTTGVQLDTLARHALWQRGHDYGHGTGHGVGSYLNVHEGPQAISPKNNVALEEGMIVSNEPGCYLAGKFGVRIENLVIVRTCKSLGVPDMLEFETISLAPLDLTLIDLKLLNFQEVQWINDYHQRVHDTLSPFLDLRLQQWLKLKTQPLALAEVNLPLAGRSSATKTSPTSGKAT